MFPRGRRIFADLYREKHSINASAQYDNSGRMVLPLRTLAAIAGITDMKYTESTGEITFTAGGNYAGYTVKMQMESKAITLTKGSDVVEASLLTAPSFIGGVAMLPMRDIAGLTGSSIKYDESGYIIVSAGELSSNISDYITAFNA